jgi:hypothetical protein
MTTTVGGILPPLPPSLVRTTVVSTPSTSGSGLIPLSASTTCFCLLRVRWALPSHMGCPTLIQTRFLPTLPYRPWVWGKGAQTLLMQGSTGGALVPFNAIPYGGGHIPPPSPSLGGAFQQPIRPNANYSLFGGGSLGPSSYTMSVGSMSFSLFDAFGNNTFSSALSRLGETPVLGNKTRCRVLFLHRE